MLTFTPDDFINERYESESRWIVTLSDGRKVYQDDDRPGVFPNSAWVRLGTFLENTPELSIVGMSIGFRDHIIQVGDNADGYYFVKSACGSPGSEVTLGFYVVGTLSNGILSVQSWKIPEIILTYEETRNPLEAGECLICPQNVLKNIDINQLQQTSTVQTPNILQNLFA